MDRLGGWGCWPGDQGCRKADWGAGDQGWAMLNN